MIPKFRAWIKAEKIMVNVSGMDLMDSFRAWIHRQETEKIGYKFSEIELMQSTGLKDKNGIEIFEGDIVRYNYYLSEDKVHLRNTDFIGEVVYRLKETLHFEEKLYVGFLLRGLEENGDEWFTETPDIKDFEVIGNKFELPKKKGKKTK